MYAANAAEGRAGNLRIIKHRAVRLSPRVHFAPVSHFLAAAFQSASYCGLLKLLLKFAWYSVHRVRSWYSFWGKYNSNALRRRRWHSCASSNSARAHQHFGEKRGIEEQIPKIKSINMKWSQLSRNALFIGEWPARRSPAPAMPAKHRPWLAAPAQSMARQVTTTRRRREGDVAWIYCFARALQRVIQRGKLVKFHCIGNDSNISSCAEAALNVRIYHNARKIMPRREK